MRTTSGTDGEPVTRARLSRDLERLGVTSGDVVLVHSSLRALGFVVGGAPTVVHALLDVIGDRGTLVVPTMTADNTDPRRWARTWGRGVPESWLDQIRAGMPAFDAARTPSVRMGAIAESVRTWPAASRSDHPQTSFAAVGHAASTVTAGHARDCHLGPDSPIGRLHRDGVAKVLLLGVGYEVCTAFHLGEYHWPGNDLRDYECVVEEAGADRWYGYRDVRLDASDFAEVGKAFEADPATEIAIGRLGAADSRLFRLGAAVDHATAWFGRHRLPRSATMDV